MAAVVLLLGNIITGLFWAAEARRTKNFEVVRVVFDGLSRSDRWFTVPGVLVILVSGIAAAGRVGLPVLGTGWLLWSSVLFAVSGVLFGVRVAPLQRRMVDLAKTSTESAEGWQVFQRVYREWEVFGVFSIAAVLAASVLMALKPTLPAL